MGAILHTRGVTRQRQPVSGRVLPTSSSRTSVWCGVRGLVQARTTPNARPGTQVAGDQLITRAGRAMVPERVICVIRRFGEIGGIPLKISGWVFDVSRHHGRQAVFFLQRSGTLRWATCSRSWSTIFVSTTSWHAPHAYSPRQSGAARPCSTPPGGARQGPIVGYVLQSAAPTGPSP